MNKKFIGNTLIIIGLIGLILKIIGSLIITKGCFGYDYFYEFLSFGIPVALIAIGFRYYRISTRTLTKKERIRCRRTKSNRR